MSLGRIEGVQWKYIRFFAGQSIICFVCIEYAYKEYSSDTMVVLYASTISLEGVLNV